MITRRTFAKSASALGFAALLSACANSDTPGNVVEVAASNPDLSTLVAAVQTAGLAETLQGEGSFTVFAPTNAAFAALPDGALESLLPPQNREMLVDVLAYHALQRTAPSAQFAGQQLNVVTAGGQTVRIDGTSGVRINDANVIRADIPASNGVIHIIDKVLIPQ